METPLHPALVHVPLGLAAILPVLVLVIWVGRLRLGWPRSTLGLAVLLQAILFAGALVAMRTGEGEKERVEARVPEPAIEQHEELATAFTWSAAVALALLGFGLLLPAGRAGMVVRAAAGGATLVVLGLGIATGRAGGKLVYVHGAANAASEQGAPAPAREHDR